MVVGYKSDACSEKWRDDPVRAALDKKAAALLKKAVHPSSGGTATSPGGRAATPPDQPVTERTSTRDGRPAVSICSVRTDEDHEGTEGAERLRLRLLARSAEEALPVIEGADWFKASSSCAGRAGPGSYYIVLYIMITKAE